MSSPPRFRTPRTHSRDTGGYVVKRWLSGGAPRSVSLRRWSGKGPTATRLGWRRDGKVKAVTSAVLLMPDPPHFLTPRPAHLLARSTVKFRHLECTPFSRGHQVKHPPHELEPLPSGMRGVYVFSLTDEAGYRCPGGPGRVLKVGKAGPNSRARWTSHHYGCNPRAQHSRATSRRGIGQVAAVRHFSHHMRLRGDVAPQEHRQGSFLLPRTRGTSVVSVRDLPDR